MAEEIETPAEPAVAPVTAPVGAATESESGPRTAATVLAELGFGGTGAKPGDVGDDDGAHGFVDPPDPIREAAKAAPEHWIGYVDPTWSGEGEPPDWALVAQWRSDADGEIVEYQENAEYRPSPSMLGWPEPKDAVDAAVQLAVSGYGPGENVLITLAKAELAVYVDRAGEPLVAVAPDGEPVVPAFTSQEQLGASARLAYVALPVAELLARIPADTGLYLNPAGPTPVRMEIEPLRQAVADLAGTPSSDVPSDDVAAVTELGEPVL